MMKRRRFLTAIAAALAASPAIALPANAQASTPSASDLQVRVLRVRERIELLREGTRFTEKERD